MSCIDRLAEAMEMLRRRGSDEWTPLRTPFQVIYEGVINSHSAPIDVVGRRVVRKEIVGGDSGSILGAMIGGIANARSSNLNITKAVVALNALDIIGATEDAVREQRHGWCYPVMKECKMVINARRTDAIGHAAVWIEPRIEKLDTVSDGDTNQWIQVTRGIVDAVTKCLKEVNAKIQEKFKGSAKKELFLVTRNFLLDFQVYCLCECLLNRTDSFVELETVVVKAVRALLEIDKHVMVALWTQVLEGVRGQNAGGTKVAFRSTTVERLIKKTRTLIEIVEKTEFTTCVPKFRVGMEKGMTRVMADQIVKMLGDALTGQCRQSEVLRFMKGVQMEDSHTLTLLKDQMEKDTRYTVGYLGLVAAYVPVQGENPSGRSDDVSSVLVSHVNRYKELLQQKVTQLNIVMSRPMKTAWENVAREDVSPAEIFVVMRTVVTFLARSGHKDSNLDECVDNIGLLTLAWFVLTTRTLQGALIDMSVLMAAVFGKCEMLSDANLSELQSRYSKIVGIVDGAMTPHAMNGILIGVEEYVAMIFEIVEKNAMERYLFSQFVDGFSDLSTCITNVNDRFKTLTCALQVIKSESTLFEKLMFVGMTDSLQHHLESMDGCADTGVRLSRKFFIEPLLVGLTVIQPSINWKEVPNDILRAVQSSMPEDSAECRKAIHWLKDVTSKAVWFHPGDKIVAAIDATQDVELNEISVLTPDETLRRASLELPGIIDSEGVCELRTVLKKHLLRVLWMRVNNETVDIEKMHDLSDDKLEKDALRLAAVLPLCDPREPAIIQRLCIPLMLKTSKEIRPTVERIVHAVERGINTIRVGREVVQKLLGDRNAAVNSLVRDTPDYRSVESFAENICTVYDICMLYAHAMFIEPCTADFVESQSVCVRRNTDPVVIKETAKKVVASCIATSVMERDFNLSILKHMRKIYERMAVFEAEPTEEHKRRLFVCVATTPSTFTPNGKSDERWAEAVCFAWKERDRVLSSDVDSYLQLIGASGVSVSSVLRSVPVDGSTRVHRHIHRHGRSSRVSRVGAQAVSPVGVYSGRSVAPPASTNPVAPSRKTGTGRKVVKIGELGPPVLQDDPAPIVKALGLARYTERACAVLAFYVKNGSPVNVITESTVTLERAVESTGLVLDVLREPWANDIKLKMIEAANVARSIACSGMQVNAAGIDSCTSMYTWVSHSLVSVALDSRVITGNLASGYMLSCDLLDILDAQIADGVLKESPNDNALYSKLLSVTAPIIVLLRQLFHIIDVALLERPLSTDFNGHGFISASIQLSEACRHYFLVLRLCKNNDSEAAFKIVSLCSLVHEGVIAVINGYAGSSEAVQNEIYGLAKSIIEIVNPVRDIAMAWTS